MGTIVTLTTELGQREPFVAAIKGTLLSGCADASLVDLSHEISPYSVVEAALFLLGSVPYFPAGTIHLCSVAPGGRGIAVRIAGQFVLCPDNGMIGLLGKALEVEEIRVITGPEGSSGGRRQFHYARELFAPAAAVLAAGGEFASLGPVVEDALRFDLREVDRSDPRKLIGQILHVDRFGNLVTTIHESLLVDAEVERIAAGHFVAYRISSAYEEVEESKPLAMFGHSGFLHLAYRNESAADRLGLSPGIQVEIFLAQG